MVRYLLLVVIAHLKWVLLKLVLLAEDHIVLHQVDKAGVDVPRFPHCKVEVKSFLVSVTTDKDVVKVSVDV